MNQAKAMDIVQKMQFGLLRARSIATENLERGGLFSEEVVDAVLNETNPWLFGEKGDGLLNGLTKVLDRGSVTGMELYNFMTIVTLLDVSTGVMIATCAETSFPEPDIAWHRELAPQQEREGILE